MKVHAGEKVKAYFMETGMSVSEFARRLNCHRQNVYDIFKRQNIDLSLLQRISKVLEHDFVTGLYRNFQTSVIMPSFEANRISGNDNIVFPDKIEIDDITKDVTYYKGTLVGYWKSFIARTNIASVHIRSGLLFADVIIESTGGKDVRACGFRKRDAREIVRLLS